MKRMKNEASDMGPERLGAANAVIETKTPACKAGAEDEKIINMAVEMENPGTVMGPLFPLASKRIR